MDEQEFQRLLNLFPVVRSRDYQHDLAASRRQTTQLVQDEQQAKEWHDAWDDIDMKEIQSEGFDDQDAFWKKLKLAAERKMSTLEAERFCKAFQQIHKKLVCEEVSRDGGHSFIKEYQHSLK